MLPLGSASPPAPDLSRRADVGRSQPRRTRIRPRAALSARRRPHRRGALPAALAQRLRVLPLEARPSRGRGGRRPDDVPARRPRLQARRRPERSSSPGCSGIAKNVCLSRRESAGRRGRLELVCDPVDLERAPAHRGRGDELIGLREALARLPERQRQAVLLRDWRGLSYEEVATAARRLARERGDPDLPRPQGPRGAPRRAAGATTRRRLAALGNLGSIAAGIKSALTGASLAAKIVAAVTTSPPSPRPGSRSGRPRPSGRRRLRRACERAYARAREPGVARGTVPATPPGRRAPAGLTPGRSAPSAAAPADARRRKTGPRPRHPALPRTGTDACGAREPACCPWARPDRRRERRSSTATGSAAHRAVDRRQGDRRRCP